MTPCRLLAVLAAFAVLGAAYPAASAPPVVALFPPENLAGAPAAPLIPALARSLAERFADRFDVRLAAEDGRPDPALRRARARALGATYVVTGALSRIGRSITLDLSIAPVEDSSAMRTVVANATEGDQAAGSDQELPPGYRKLAIEASARLKYLFFGDDSAGEGTARRRIPKPSGTVVRSRPVPGDVVSIAAGDVDGDGRAELIAGFPEEVVVYRMEGEDLVLRSRIAILGGGLIRVETADVDRDGKTEILVVRYLAGRALSDILRYDGKEYRRAARDLPYFLRALGSGGGAGAVLAGQESSPATVFRGPVFRVEWTREGDSIACRTGDALPLPEGTTVYGFVPVRGHGAVAYATIGERGRIRLADGGGRVVWEGIDGVGETETALEAPIAGGLAESARLFLPGRLLAADLDGDGTDEVITVRNLASAGAFFDGIRVQTNAEALCFTRDGEGLRLAWRTQQFGTSARDVFLESAPGSAWSRLGIASRERGKIFDRLGEWRLVWVR